MLFFKFKDEDETRLILWYSFKILNKPMPIFHPITKGHDEKLRYLKPREIWSYLTERELEILFNNPSSRLLNKKPYLSVLIFMPKVAQKVSKITLKETHSSEVLVPKRITSSTKSKWVKEIWEEILMPLIFPLFWVSLINRLSPSMTRINSRGDNEQPYLIPLVAEKKQEGVPFTCKEKFAEDKQPMIQLTPIRGTPICRRISLK